MNKQTIHLFSHFFCHFFSHIFSVQYFFGKHPLILMLCLFHHPAFNQVIGDFQSRQSGNWNESTTWQQWSGTVWSNVLASDGFPKVTHSVSSAGSYVTSHQVMLPSDIVAGDLLILLWTDNASNGSTLGGTALTGWTALYNDNTSNNRRASFYKIANGTEGSSMTLTTTQSENSVHIVYRIAAGTWEGTPEVSSLSTASTRNPQPPTLNPRGWDLEPTLWIIAAHIAGDGGTNVAPPNAYSANQLIARTGGSTWSTSGAIVSSAYRFASIAQETPGSYTIGDTRSTSAATLSVRGKKVHHYPRSMFPIVASTATSRETSTTRTHSITMPDGISSGDLLLVFYADGDVNSSITASGWTTLYNNLDAAGRNRRAAFYRIADGSEGATADFITTSSERSAHTAYRILKGSFQGTPVAGTVAVSSTNNRNPDPPEHNPGWGEKNILWIAAGHATADDNSPLPAAPTLYNNLLTTYTGSSGSYNARILTAQRELAGAVENPGAFTLAENVNWAANTVAIQGCGAATVLATHTVTVTENVEVPEVSVNAGGTVAINNGIAFTTPGSGSFTVSGTLQTGTDGTAALVGEGTFNLNSNATLWVSSPAGIAATANTGNIRVTGGRTFSTSANYHFNGVQDQLTGDALSVVNNLTVSGASTKTLTNNITVNGTLTFDNARIQSTVDKLLTMAKANSISGYGQNGMVIGSLKIIGTGNATPYEVVFPLRGKNQLQPVNITYGSVSAVDAVMVSYVGNAQAGGKHPDVEDVSSSEHWDITPSWSAGSQNAVSGVAVELSYRSSNNDKYFATRIPESYGLGHFNGTQWEIAGPVATLKNSTADNGITGTVGMGQIKSFSPFTPIAISQALLPVDLGAFSAQLDRSGNVVLTWTTHAESLNKGFRIEKKVEGSIKGFEPIGYVYSKSLNGNSATTLEYSFVDQLSVAGKIAYYRIIQEDLDGKTTSSEVRLVRIPGLSQARLFPNPSAGDLFFSYPGSGNRFDITISDLSGKPVQKISNVTENPFRFSIGANGLYLIRIFNRNTQETSFERVFIQR